MSDSFDWYTTHKFDRHCLEQFERESKMTLHESTFDYLKPSDRQMQKMNETRDTFDTFARELDHLLPDGPDKTYILRILRTAAMWANVAITRQPDGAPRQ